MKKYVPVVVWVSLGIFAASLIMYLFALYSPTFADLITGSVGFVLRLIMSLVSHLIPISLFEVILLFLIPALILVIVLVVRDKRGAVARVRTTFSLLAVVGIIYSGYILVMAVAYRTTPLSEHLGITESADITPEELYDTTLAVVERVNELSGEIEREGGISRMPYSLNELSHKIYLAYDTVGSEYPFFINFVSRAKPVIFSSVMSDMGITGIYTYFTGEANVNVEYPDFSVAFVTAHEMAHQRGIMRENEANFMAYLATTSSTDPFIQYSGYLYMYQYLASALYHTDKDLYRDIQGRIDEAALQDIAASSEITVAHKDSLLNKIFDALNDAYLKSNGTPGTISYGYVVRLAVAYHLQAE